MYLGNIEEESIGIKIDSSLKLPVMIVNIAIFTIYNNKLCVVMVVDKKSKKRELILPGGIILKGKDLSDSLDGIIIKNLGISLNYKEQLFTYSNTNEHDSGVHFICTTYFTLINKDILLNDLDLTKINIVEFDKIDVLELGYQQKNIIKFARNRLNFRLEYTTIGKYMLPQRFSIPQMQKDYEIMFGEEFDKRNFRKKVEQLNIVKFTGEFDKKNSNRPAKLYEFASKDVEYLDEDRINLELRISKD